MNSMVVCNNEIIEQFKAAQEEIRQSLDEHSSLQLKSTSVDMGSKLQQIEERVSSNLNAQLESQKVFMLTTLKKNEITKESGISEVHISSNVGNNMYNTEF